MPAIRAIVQTRQELLEKAAREGPAWGSPVACWDFLAVEPNYPAFPCVQEDWLFPRVLAPSSMGEQRQMWTESQPPAPVSLRTLRFLSGSIVRTSDL